MVRTLNRGVATGGGIIPDRGVATGLDAIPDNPYLSRCLFCKFFPKGIIPFTKTIRKGPGINPDDYMMKERFKKTLQEQVRLVCEFGEKAIARGFLLPHELEEVKDEALNSVLTWKIPSTEITQLPLVQLFGIAYVIKEDPSIVDEIPITYLKSFLEAFGELLEVVAPEKWRPFRWAMPSN